MSEERRVDLGGDGNNSHWVAIFCFCVFLWVLFGLVIYGISRSTRVPSIQTPKIELPAPMKIDVRPLDAPALDGNRDGVEP